MNKSDVGMVILHEKKTWRYLLWSIKKEYLNFFSEHDSLGRALNKQEYIIHYFQNSSSFSVWNNIADAYFLPFKTEQSSQINTNIIPLSFYEFVFDNGGVDKVTVLLLFLIGKRLRLDCWLNDKAAQTRWYRPCEFCWYKHY